MSESTPTLSEAHRALVRHLAVQSASFDPPFVFEVVTEWLGYLPYGLYIWITNMPDSAFPAPWDTGTMKHLAATGYLDRLDYQVSDDDEYDTRTRYGLTAKARALA